MNKPIAYLFACCYTLTIVLSAQASLECLTTNVINVGRLYNYQTVTNTFHFVNRGNNDIKIDNLLSTCPCIRGDFNKSIVKPDEEVKIISFLDAQTVHGVFTRGLWLISDDPIRPRILLKITGEVLPLFTGLPDDIISLQSSEDNPVFTNHFTIRATTTEYTLKQPQSRNPMITANSTLTRDPTNTYSLITRLSPVRKSKMNFSLNLPIDGPREVNDLTIRFKIETGVHLTVSPSQLVITEVDTPLARSFYVNTTATEANPAALTWEPQVEGLVIVTETSSRSSKPPSAFTHIKAESPSAKPIRYKCVITASPEALKKIMAEKEPGITLMYPEHKPVKVPLTLFKRGAPPSSAFQRGTLRTKPLEGAVETPGTPDNQ